VVLLVEVPTVSSMVCVLTAEPKEPTLFPAKQMDPTRSSQVSLEYQDRFSVELEEFVLLLLPVPETLTVHPTTTKLALIVKSMVLALAAPLPILHPPARPLMVVR